MQQSTLTSTSAFESVSIASHVCMMLFGTVVLLSAAPFVASRCYEPSPAFPVPDWSEGGNVLKSSLAAIEADLQTLLARSQYDAASVSIELTSAKELMWSWFHTARKHNETRPGTTHVNSDSLYRIASITKTFTTLAILQQHAAGNLSLDDTVDKYLPELGGELPWKDITLRILASQLSGIPREFAQSDLITELADPVKAGLPPASRHDLPNCDTYSNFQRPCDKSDLVERLKHLSPVFAPNQRSTYSNVAFEILGLVVEKVTGHTYSEYISTAIFAPLNMSTATVDTPESDVNAVLPAIDFNYWDVQAGVQAPTGGIYASVSDMGKYLRYVLSHYNSIATGVNWLLPASWAGGSGSYYGMPWEIFRTDRLLLNSRRPVTFVTKAGGLPGYYSKVYLMEEYGLGLTILVGGQSELLDAIEELVAVSIIRAAEDAVWRSIHKSHDGYYQAVDSHLNSSISFSSSPRSGLILDSFLSNGTDVYDTLISSTAEAAVGNGRPWRAQLTPTLLFKNQTTQQGEIWHVVAFPTQRDTSRPVFDEFCHTTVDPVLYAGLPLNEVVFWREENVVELPAWRVSLAKVASRDDSVALVVQN